MPYLPRSCIWLRGQLERGNETDYLHWQLVVCFARKVRLGTVREVFGEQMHAELSRSASANSYVWKEDTRIEGTQFELGARPFQRNSQEHWDEIRDKAKSGNLEEIPSQVFVTHYGSLSKIARDYMRPNAIERTVCVYWGPSGVGKSRRAWNEAGLDAFPKDPNTKFWDGYRGHENVVIDEFRGLINISHVLRWFDRYPVNVETKGGGTVLKAKSVWITSNLSPREWYPELDDVTMNALLRRLRVVHIPM